MDIKYAATIRTCELANDRSEPEREMDLTGFAKALEAAKRLREAAAGSTGPDARVFSYNDVDEVRAAFERLYYQCKYRNVVTE